MKILFLIPLLFACATPPEPATKNQASASYAFNLRTLEIDQTKPGLRYPYRVCSKTFLGICTSWTLTEDDYDLTDPAIRAQLYNANFVCTVEAAPQ